MFIGLAGNPPKLHDELFAFIYDKYLDCIYGMMVKAVGGDMELAENSSAKSSLIYAKSILLERKQMAVRD